MKQKEIKINCPDGYEIDKENSTFECIKFKPIKELPKTWEEYCKNTKRKIGECWIDFNSSIRPIADSVGTKRDSDEDRNFLPSKELAEAMLALCQLIQLRDCYNDGWKPDWSNPIQKKFIIYSAGYQVLTGNSSVTNSILVFKTEELCNQFFENFKDLIEIAKPLL